MQSVKYDIIDTKDIVPLSANEHTCHLLSKTVHIIGFIDIPHTICSYAREALLVPIASLPWLLDGVPEGERRCNKTPASNHRGA